MNLKKTLLISLSATALSFAANAQSGGYPPDAQPGECFARVLIPETTEVVTEQVVDQPERSEITVVEAVYETVTQVVTTKEEGIAYDVIPATYTTVTETVMVEPERVEKRVIPATTETYTEQVLVRPAYTTWKPGAGLFGRSNDLSAATGDQATGELLCRVEVPAQYRTVTRTRVATAERTEETIIPAVYKEVTKTVVAEPERIVERVIPAETDTIEVQRLVTPEREEITVIPATYKTIEKRVVTAGGGLQWREVLCDTNTDTNTIRAIQAALSDAGYPTRADGEFGPDTLNAMEAFQRDRGLPVGYLTMDTVEALGVSAGI